MRAYEEKREKWGTQLIDTSTADAMSITTVPWCCYEATGAPQNNGNMTVEAGTQQGSSQVSDSLCIKDIVLDEPL